MALPSQRVLPALARGSKSLPVQTQGNGHARLAPQGLGPLNDGLFARLCRQLQVHPAAADYAHFTRVEVARTGRRSWIDQQTKTDLSVSTTVQKGNKVDFRFSPCDSLWVSCALYQRC